MNAKERELLEAAVVIIENDEASGEHVDWLTEARLALNPATYDIYSVDQELVERKVEIRVKGEQEAMKRLCTLAREKALSMPNKPHTGIVGSNECAVFMGVYRVFSYKAVKVA